MCPENRLFFFINLVDKDIRNMKLDVPTLHQFEETERVVQYFVQKTPKEIA
jgi:hypothetical protein